VSDRDPSPSEPDSEHEDDPPPPILGSWRNLYILEFVTLAFLVFLFYLVTKAYE
jgi:hypothetical protein